MAERDASSVPPSPDATVIAGASRAKAAASETGRQGIVLAAGLGSRLASEATDGRPKPLMQVGGRPLIERTLESLARAGCTEVVIVVGYEAETLRRGILESLEHAVDLPNPPSLRFVYNPDFRLSNGVSLLTAAPVVRGAFVLTMADHVFGPEVMETARRHAPPPEGATLLVDRKLDTIFDMDDATKVLADGTRLVRIGKDLTDFNCVDTGCFLGTPALLAAIERVYAAKGDASLSAGVAALAAAGHMEVLDIGDGWWQDVDTPAMLTQAEAVLRSRTPPRSR